MNVFVTLPDGELRDDFFPNEVRHRLESLGSVAWNPSTDDLSEDALRERIDGVDVLVTGWGSPRVTADVLQAADDLQLIAHTGGSVGTLVTDAVYDAGIRVVSANDVMAEYTAEHTLGLIIAKLRAVPELDASMKAGEFDADDVDIRSLYGKDVGLVGLGTIGRKLLDHLASFDVSASIYDPYVDPEEIAKYPFATLTDLETALDAAVVSVHAARTDETIGMLDADRLARIPDGALFVNTARAEIVDEAALMAELRSGRLAGVFDVYHQEPLPADHELRTLDNVLLTPHVGGSQIRGPLTESVIDDIERFERGRPLEHEISRRHWKTMTR
ncbi:hydroxyacid dehydrogenase [Natrinema sp. 74]|uniref:hydroxyacid dehydrogenase n=1 Tax=Natrinema sp. 74 TaxID=3384159 RepID=UPI0038D40704